MATTETTERYQILGSLGKGGMGQVFVGRLNLPMGQTWPCALKVILPDYAHDDQVLRRFAREGHVGWKFTHHFPRHDNLVRLYNFDRWRGSPVLVMELVHGPDVHAASTQLTGNVPMIQRIAHDILLALAHVHQYGHLHGDVSGANILLSEDDGRVKLGDFGLAERHDRWNADGFSGPSVVVAPEILHFERPTPSSDIYALGAVLYSLLTGQPPYGKGKPDIIRAAMRKGGSIKQIPGDVPAEMKSLVVSMLHLDQRERPTADAALGMLTDNLDAMASRSDVTAFVSGWLASHPDHPLAQLPTTARESPQVIEAAIHSELCRQLVASEISTNPIELGLRDTERLITNEPVEATTTRYVGQRSTNHSAETAVRPRGVQRAIWITAIAVAMLIGVGNLFMQMRIEQLWDARIASAPGSEHELLSGLAELGVAVSTHALPLRASAHKLPPPLATPTVRSVTKNSVIRSGRKRQKQVTRPSPVTTNTRDSTNQTSVMPISGPFQLREPGIHHSWQIQNINDDVSTKHEEERE